jgi:hypothetical protein
VWATEKAHAEVQYELVQKNLEGRGFVTETSHPDVAAQFVRVVAHLKERAKATGK